MSRAQPGDKVLVMVSGHWDTTSPSSAEEPKLVEATYTGPYFEAFRVLTPKGGSLLVEAANFNLTEEQFAKRLQAWRQAVEKNRSDFLRRVEDDFERARKTYEETVVKLSEKFPWER